MASPKMEVFFVKSTEDNLPLTGAVGDMEFETYVNDLGAPITPPTIVEIGGGLYGFTPVFASAIRGIAYVLTTTALGNPDRVYRYMRPEDWNPDKIDTLMQIETGQWEIKTTGPDANRLVFYDVDGTTVLYKFDLFNSLGSPTVLNPYKRVPV